MKLREKMKRFWTLDVHNHEGFTLVELIIVIAILAILASVAVVGYSAYIEKANKAADEQLLRQINQAFQSACLDNGCDVFDIKTAVWDMTNMTVKSVNGDTDHSIVKSFKEFFDVNDPKFKVIKYLKFENGMFVESDSQYSELFNTLKEKYGEDIANKILTSNLGKIGTETLFDQMNGAMDLAGELNLHTLAGEPFANAYFEYLGIDLSDYDSDEAAQAALDAKLEALGVDDATAATNAIALYAAQNSKDLTTDNLEKWLSGDKTTDDLQNSASGDTLAEAAAIYSLYLSYQQQTNGTVPKGSALEGMTDALSDDEFLAWVKDEESDAQAELDAYKTYMDLVNEAAKDDTTRDEILANGFQDPELEELMKELIGN